MTTPAIDYSTPIGQLRSLIPDVEKIQDESNLDAPPTFMFSNDYLSGLLALNGGNVRLAAADACEVLGTSEALILKVYTNQDQSFDGAKLMAQYLNRAKQLRATAADAVLTGDLDTDEGTLFLVPFISYPLHLEPR